MTVPLPTPWYPQWSHSNEQAAYTADQMRTYAAAVSAADNRAMLEALEKLVYTLEDEVLMHDDQRAAMTQARAAIKAAKGEA